MFRIYRDVRFSKDKSPYKPYASAHFSMGKGVHGPGYYLHLQPGQSFLAGGMWMPEQMAQAQHKDKLKALGLEIDPESLADPTASPLGAVVSLGGCSASFVSPDGLIATNHHCATGALQYNSTPDDNLLQKGYLAKTRADEKWNGPGARVMVTQSLRDVTKEMRDGLAAMFSRAA